MNESKALNSLLKVLIVGINVWGVGVNVLDML